MTSARVALLAGLLLTLALVGLEARYQRHAGPLWRDEVTSVNVAAQPTLADVLAAVPYDSFPLGWPLVLHGWIAAGQGDSDGELRRLGFVVMLAIFAVLWWAGRRLRLDAPLVTLLLLGMSPSVLVYGGQVRGYGLGALAIAWCFAATWHYLQAPGTGRLLLAALAATAAVQTYFANAFLVAAFAVGAAAVTLPAGRIHALAGLVAVDALAAASLLLDLPSFTYALQVAPLEQRETSLAWLVEVFRHALAPGVPLLAACWILAPVLAIAGCLWTWRRAAQDRAAADLACFVLVSALAALPAYFGYLHGVARLPTQYWYYLSLMAVLALACDAGTALLARRWRHGALARTAVVAATALAVAPAVAATVPLRMTNVDAVAALVEREAGPNDFVVVFPWYVGITFARYYRGSAPWATLPDLENHELHAHLEIREHMRRGDAALAEELAHVERTLRSGAAVWLVGQPIAPGGGEPAPRLPPAPSGPKGWSAGPYLEGWELQLGALLQAHAGEVQRIALPELGPVNTWENVPLHRARGWR